MAISKIGSNATGFGSDLTITDGDLLFATAAKGVVLGATSNTDANTLEDYEEGSHTIAISAGTSGTITAKSTHRVARYVKIGRLCFIGCDLRTDSSSSPNGTVTVSLPFTIADEDDSQAFSSSLATVGITYQSNQQGNFFLRGVLNSASAGVHYSTNTTNLGLQAENSGIDGNEELQFSMCYYTA